MGRIRKAAVAAPWSPCSAAIAVVGNTGRFGVHRRGEGHHASSCHLGNGVKHVVEILFDNTHYNRDNPNVLSDLEQMPALKNFITDHGTLLSNMHTPLIAHTADDSLTGYTGLYGDRHGQGLTNTYETYQPDGSVVPHSSFAYWTSTYAGDPVPEHAVLAERAGRRLAGLDAAGAVGSVHTRRVQRRRRLDGEHGAREHESGSGELLRPELAGGAAAERRHRIRSSSRRRTTISVSASTARRARRSAQTHRRSSSARRRRRTPR